MEWVSRQIHQILIKLFTNKVHGYFKFYLIDNQNMIITTWLISTATP